LCDGLTFFLAAEKKYVGRSFLTNWNKIRLRKCFTPSHEQIATIYELRWEIEVFSGWWKRHLKGYRLMARYAYGFMVQILAGLITDLLLAIYCQEHFGEKVSIKRGGNCV
jgi:hypothetical protein